MLLKNIGALTPASFFSFIVSVPIDELTTLPDTSGLLAEEELALVSIKWNKKGLFFEVKGKFDEEDLIELFIDTKDMKPSSITPFCHHFVFSLEGALEKTKFRGDELRPKAEPHHFKVNWSKKKIEIAIEADGLYGFSDTKKVGFTYRIQSRGEKQCFSASSRTDNIEQHPSLWATLQLAE